ncbi:uncharacterized protein DUF4357 [Nonlabens dokdonensis]|jgi:hypothetical protein|uniref:Methionine sulfoxide reductase A n=2 Tax=Nonlabens dokdonensis TaxID=328515 RepID=L7WFK1_NONDD|nr:GIY-YIG nuclease family protein [Nonlabens dokdonensis]AGC78731.1 methionine sulfoxide reductase A [Nonlabens dokdonensis DSW-6]PZX39143.1 uncharacterized protein DUF4357 [Nonlabens dokdonensis]
MSNFGKTIKIFLIDGEPNGRMTCELSNWTGKALKIPRKKIKESSDRSELLNTGIYILIGKSPKSETKNLAYIGEAEEIYTRLNQQLSKKEFWNEAIVFVSKDENLNKAHIKYLESRLHEIAVKTNRYEIDNGINPTRSTISESDVAEMEEFLENIKLLVNALGYKIFEELPQNLKTDVKDSVDDTFYLTGLRMANAQGRLTNDGFVVLKNSVISPSTTEGCSDHWIRLRERLIKDSIIIKTQNHFIFNESYLFSSPSAAAAIVIGRNANGLKEWKLKNGKTIKELESF